MSFSNALPNGNASEGLGAFDAAEAAAEFAPLPPGIYKARVVSGDVCKTKAGSEAFKVTWEILEGEQAKRTLSKWFSFTAKAITYSKRDLLKFGLATAAHLLSPFPGKKEYVCKLTVALQQSDDGTMRNDLKFFEVLEVKDCPVAEFLICEDETQ